MLTQFDHWLFEKVNQSWTNSFFDFLFPAITDLHKNPLTLLVVLPLLAFWIWKRKVLALKWLLVLIFSIGLADLISYRVIKKNVLRDRPQYTGIQVNLRTHEHTGTSFPSNHAANMGAAATTLTLAAPPLWPVFFAIGLSVAYSRVYVGVHFPIDVAAGFALGSLVAILIWLALRKWIERSTPFKESIADDPKNHDSPIIKNGEGSFREQK